MPVSPGVPQEYWNKGQGGVFLQLNEKLIWEVVRLRLKNIPVPQPRCLFASQLLHWVLMCVNMAASPFQFSDTASRAWQLHLHVVVICSSVESKQHYHQDHPTCYLHSSINHRGNAAFITKRLHPLWKTPNQANHWTNYFRILRTFSVV